MSQNTNPNVSAFIGRTNHRNIRLKFGIRKADRRYHMFLIGQTGTSKTSLLENLIVQDMTNEETSHQRANSPKLRILATQE